VTIYDLKPAFQGALRPLCQRLFAAGVTANQVTVAAAAMSLLTGALLAALADVPAAALVVPVVLFVRMALNAIDGMLAREHGLASRLGGILNELGDVVSDAGLYLAFAFVPGMSPAWVVAAVLLGILTEMTGVVAVQIGAERRYDGPMGKSDRAFAWSAIALLLGLGVPAGLWTTLVLVAMCALMLVTIRNRAQRALANDPGPSDAS